MRVIGIFIMTVGAAMIVGAIPYYLYEARISRAERAEVEALREELSVWQDSLGTARTNGDSVVAKDRIRQRVMALDRAAYHASPRARRVGRWWRPTGTGPLMLVTGLLFMIVGGLTLRRALTAPWNLPPLDDRHLPQG